MTTLLLVLALSAAQPCCEPGVACGCVEWDSGTVPWYSGDDLEPGTGGPLDWSDLYDAPGVDDSDITDYGTFTIPSMLCPLGLPPVFDGEYWTCLEEDAPGVDGHLHNYLPTDCLPGSLITVSVDGLLACSGAKWSCAVTGGGVDVKVTTEKRTEALALAVAAAEQIAGSVAIECEER